MSATRRSWRERVAGVRIDLTPLRTSRDFRLLFSAGTVFYLGGMVSYVALPFQLYQLTGSSFAVGLMGLVELLPLLVFGLYGGALADHVDRRTMLVSTGVAQVVLTALLLVNATLASPRLWAIYAVGALLSVAQSLQRPSREALIPRTVRHDELPAAVSLTSLGSHVGQLAGPTLGGVLVSTTGVASAFAVDVAGLVAATVLFAAMRPYPPGAASTPPSLAGIVEGIRYAVRRRDLLGTYLIDIVAMFMAMPVVLFPALATGVFHRPGLLGLLYTAETVGGLAATATSGWTSRVHHHGRAVVVAATVYGASIGLVGLAPGPWSAMALLAVAGAADMVSAVFRGVIWHQTIPDDKRGRLAGIEMLSYSIGPLGGQARAGLVAGATSVRASIVSGGVLCVIGVAGTAVWLSDFWRYDARTDVHAVHEREVRARAGRQ
ncbi:MAG: MFS transporter [Rhodoferax sp.]|nr:MFS transporter [Actinomycetota bacterium]